MRKYSLIIILVYGYSLFSQKEPYNWYFPPSSGLSFSTNPPTVLMNSAIMIGGGEGPASISDKNGNLLFYTDGLRVYNANHTIMANGNGLFGGVGSTTQGATIVKQPGNNNIYYIFSIDNIGGPTGLSYSTVDMSLAAGLGSVTVKNSFLNAPTTEKCVAVKHCNATDVWVVTHDVGSNAFRSYLVNAVGVNTPAVISNVGTSLLTSSFTIGQMKVSPNGKKLGLANRIYPPPSDLFELYDFDNATGLVSNQLILLSNVEYIYGCEFSPDGTKFYGSFNGPANTIVQWDLCAGSNSAIVASNYSIITTTGANNALQLAPDGKIYVAKASYYLAAINNPNANGINCNYTNTAINLSNGSSLGLPNFINSDLRLTTQFSVNAACNNYSFAAQPSIGNTCAYAANTLSAIQWNFGDPSSGAANTSSLNSPTHSYTNGGNYTVQLILQYDCYIDTIKQVVQVNIPVLSVSGKTVICRNDKLSLTASGANTYSWSNGVTSANYTATPNSNIVYTVTGTNTTNLCSSSKVVSVTVNPCLGIGENLNNNLLHVYPNPSQGIFNFVTSESSALKVFNEMGIMVYEIILAQGENKIDLQHLKRGLYFAHTQSRSSKVIYKIFKEE
jgi:hypothetical protein